MPDIYKLDGKLFRYNEDHGVVEYVMKADADTIREEAEWKAEHNGRGLYDIDADGYMVIESAGLLRENWNNRETRDEYLHGWIDELDEEMRCMEAEFEKYELPYLQGVQ